MLLPGNIDRIAEKIDQHILTYKRTVTRHLAEIVRLTQNLSLCDGFATAEIKALISEVDRIEERLRAETNSRNWYKAHEYNVRNLRWSSGSTGD